MYRCFYCTVFPALYKAQRVFPVQSRTAGGLRFFITYCGMICTYIIPTRMLNSRYNKQDIINMFRRVKYYFHLQKTG